MDSHISMERETLVTEIIYSPYESAQIISISKEEALKIKGVHSVITAEDIPGENNILGQYGNCRLFAEEQVEYKGQILAVILAENSDIAKNAVSFVCVEYKPLPPVRDIEEAVIFNSSHESLKEYESTSETVNSDKLNYVKTSQIIPDYNLEKVQFTVIAEPNDEGGISINKNNFDLVIYRSSLNILLSLKSDKIFFNPSDDQPSPIPFDLIDLSICGIASLCALISKKKVSVSSYCSKNGAKRLGHGGVELVSTIGYGADGKIGSVKSKMKLDSGSQSGMSGLLWLGFCNVIKQLNHCSNFDLLCDRCKTNEVPNGSNTYDGAWLGLLVLEETFHQIALKSSKTLSEVRSNNLDVDDSFEKLEPIYKEKKELIKETNNSDKNIKKGINLIYLTTNCGLSSKGEGENVCGAALTEVELDMRKKSIRLVYCNIIQHVDRSSSKNQQRAFAVTSFISGLKKINVFDESNSENLLKKGSFTQIFPDELYCRTIPRNDCSLMIPYCLSLSAYFAIYDAMSEFDREFSYHELTHFSMFMEERV